MSRRVEEAIAAVPREWFLPPTERRNAAYDGPLPIGYGQTNSQPRTVAMMLTLLDVQPGRRVLDVGSGSAWTTALLGHLVGPEGTVIGVERIPQLAEWGSASLDNAGMPWARVQLARPGVLGWPEEAPYDRVLVSAEPRVLPQALIDQLGDDGVMVIPVDGRMLRVVRSASGLDIGRFGHFRFVPLIDPDDQAPTPSDP